MSKIGKLGIFISILMAFMVACSTEKNTPVNRGFHYVNARFNGHFNAKELINTSLYTFRHSLEEDYHTLLPLEAIPDTAQVEALYTPIDTAISKIKIVIADHSMPTLDKPSKKNSENNNYIDENWITLGQAYYYRRDYETALKNFKFIKKYFENDPSNFIGEMWMAKTYIRIGDLSEARMTLEKLNAAKKTQENNDSAKSSATKKKKSSKVDKLNNRAPSGKEEKPAEFPKKIHFELARTNADLAIAEKNYQLAIEFLEAALEDAKLSEDKGRTNYILGQLYQQEGNNGLAVERYKKSRKYKIPYQMSFSASLKASVLEGGPKIKKSLNKMLRDAKNAEFKDQIYYALGQIELNENKEDLAMEHFTNSAFYSTTNKRQKGMAYEKMGNLRYAKKDYVKAQKYYDSCQAVVDDRYPNIKEIRNKATKLADLVLAVETAYAEDSLQRVARMDPDEQEAFIKKVIKQQEEEAKLRAQREAEKLRELAKNTGAMAQDMSKGGSYWSNSNQMQEGARDFEKKWGQRPNEDHWRRKDKTIMAPPTTEEDLAEDGTPKDSTATAAPTASTGPTVESLLKNLPSTEEDFIISNNKLVKAWYDAGIIYKEMLNEKELAKTNFSNILNKNFESDYNLMAAYQMYKLAENGDQIETEKHRDYILNNYPLSDYANYLRDPDYFIKKRERDALAEQAYVAVLQRYNRKVYYPVISKAQSVMEEEKDNVFRSKYMLLLAMSIGQTNDDKSEMLPVLQRVLTEYPSTPEATRAQEMIDIINNGYSVSTPVNFANKYIFNYEEKIPHLVLIFIEGKNNIDISKTKINDFTREFFPKSKAQVSTSLLGAQVLVMVAEFPTEKEAKEYTTKYKNTKKHLLDLQSAKTLIISRANLKLLYETNKVEEYTKFYEDYY